MTSAIPRGWVATTLGEIRRNAASRAVPSDMPDEALELWSVPSFETGKPEHHRGSEIGSDKQTVVPGTVLVCKINPRINRVWVVGPQTDRRQIASTEWIPFFPVDGIEPQYLCYFLRQNDFRHHLASNVSGVGGSLMRVRPAVVERFPLLLPPTNEQRRIVAAIEEHLSQLDAAVAGLKRVQAQLPRYRAAVLKAAVEGRLAPTGTARSEGNGLPTEWRWETVAALAERVDYGTSAKTAETGDIPVLRMGNIRDGTLVLDSLRYLPADHREFPELLLQAGDILFNRTNSAELVGKSAGYRGHPYPCSFASYLIRVRLRPDCLPEFFAAVLNSVYGRRWIGEVVSQQVGQANVSGGKLKNFRIPLPPQNVQGHIVAEMERCFSLAVAVEGQVASGLMRAQRLRQSILRRAFSGKLVPQDSNDEPAGLLLERILIDRASAPIKPGRPRRASTG